MHKNSKRKSIMQPFGFILAISLISVLALYWLALQETTNVTHAQLDYENGILPTTPVSVQEWYAEGQAKVEKNARAAFAAARLAQQKADNIILFVGDGMGVSTVTAARIFDGQNKGMAGEEHELFFEHFPHIALAKTYNTNQQTPDSAGTMTAMLTGVKTKAGVLSVNDNTIRGNCASQKGNELTTVLELAEVIGMSTGIVTTARVTHATPGAAYAHIMDRDFENDADAVKFSGAGDCIDIARQLLAFPARFSDFNNVDGLEVVLGGGRRGFLPSVAGADPETGQPGKRMDGRDLTQEWQDNFSSADYVWNEDGFAAVNTAKVKHLLGLFNMSHMEYEHDRNNDIAGEPSLTAMTVKAIEILAKNDEGYILIVESGRIDHAHHATNPYRALSETVELANAVQAAHAMTDVENTLIIVTADHSHVFTIAGYPTRGNPILGKVISNDKSGHPQRTATLAADNLPYTTLGYANGRGFNFLSNSASADAIKQEAINVSGRSDLGEIDSEHPGFHPETLVPAQSETHGAEDVAIYASGPGSPLINGVMEQHAIYHVINRAADLEQRAQKLGFK